MYGIIIEGIRFMVESHFGTVTWAQCLDKAQVTNPDFSTHERYSERIVPNVLIALAEITGLTSDDVGVLAGKYFVHFMCKYGYDKLLRVLGRRFSDFLKSMDNLHEYFRLSYPRIHPPSFQCEKEDGSGLVLHYRSRRDGYISYVMGQMIEIAKMFYKTDIEVQVMKKEQRRGVSYVILRVNFDNPDYKSDIDLKDQLRALTEFIPVDSVSVLSMFPFYMCFNKNMEIVLAGKAITYIIPDIVGKRVDEEFELVRPFVKFNWDACKHHINNMFKLQTFKPVRKVSNGFITYTILQDGGNKKVEVQKPVNPTVTSRDAEAPRDRRSVNGYDASSPLDDDDAEDEAAYSSTRLRLKGQMVYVRKSEAFVYLPTSEVDTLDQMFTIGLYINDYSISDCNRDIIMASVQQSDSLKELLNGEQEKSRRLMKNMKEISNVRQKSKEVLTEMMPRHVALQVLRGIEHTYLGQTFDDATVAFIKVFDFGSLVAQLTSVQTVTLINEIYSRWDEVCDRHGVYKVESLCETYMIACGVRARTIHHAEYVADACLEVVQVMSRFQEATTGRGVPIKAGVHSGPVMAGVAGHKVPRYCLFGETLNCASRIEVCNKTPMSIVISVATKNQLERWNPKVWHFKDQGNVDVKGKGKLQIFELCNKTADARSYKDPLTTNHEDDVDSHVDDQYSRLEEFESRLSGSISRMSVMKSMMSGTLSDSGSRAENNESPGPNEHSDHEADDTSRNLFVVPSATRSSGDTAGLQVKTGAMSVISNFPSMNVESVKVPTNEKHVEDVKEMMTTYMTPDETDIESQINDDDSLEPELLKLAPEIKPRRVSADNDLHQNSVPIQKSNGVQKLQNNDLQKKTEKSSAASPLANKHMVSNGTLVGLENGHADSGITPVEEGGKRKTENSANFPNAPNTTKHLNDFGDVGLAEKIERNLRFKKIYNIDTTG